MIGNFEGNIADISQHDRYSAKVERLSLKGGDTDGTSGDMSESVIDAKIGQAKAEVDTEFAKLRGDLGLLSAKVDRLPGLWAMIATVATAGAAIVGVLLAVMAFGGDRFDSGMSASGIVAQVRDEQRVVDARQDAQFTEMGNKLDAILARLPGDTATAADTTTKAN